MTRSFLQRTTAWLCIAVALLTGTTSAQGFVLCLEADGCVRVEAQRGDADCSACEGHETVARPMLAVESAASGQDCPCVDLAVPGCRQEQRVLPGSIELQIRAWIAQPPELFVRTCSLAGLSDRAPPAAVPRPPDSLALIRTVVLLL